MKLATEGFVGSFGDGDFSFPLVEFFFKLERKERMKGGRNAGLLPHQSLATA